MAHTKNNTNGFINRVPLEKKELAKGKSYGLPFPQLVSGFLGYVRVGLLALKFPHL